MPARSRAWHLEAACVHAPDGLFYGPEGEKPPERLAREARALEFCAACPVLEPCRTHALALPETYGVWGGTTEANRNAVRRGRISASALPAPGPARVTARASSLPAPESATATVQTSSLPAPESATATVQTSSLPAPESATATVQTSSLPHRGEQRADVDSGEADPGVACAVGQPERPGV
ncbi:WhiB family transcriptional regulator [Actinopolymorpha singaporensis]|uniref:Transcriptional regulator WhiB n=1 Tax=Actinopolymorpha singaporensis TaxID=117157 RepID=A0A1H1LB94_9ACTN|nr:WhiB family transcriptional regulator [Actinopolymorpha singaporensis]SDR71315.1 Transcription factor WhiB [Actinopolymorpha singaporensis]